MMLTGRKRNFTADIEQLASELLAGCQGSGHPDSADTGEDQHSLGPALLGLLAAALERLTCLLERERRLAQLATDLLVASGLDATLLGALVGLAQVLHRVEEVVLHVGVLQQPLDVWPEAGSALSRSPSAPELAVGEA